MLPVRAVVVVGLLALAGGAQDELEPAWWVTFSQPPRIHVGAGSDIGVAEHVAWPDGEGCDFGDDRARLTFAARSALGVDDGSPFTLQLELRTNGGGFSTPLMCREGGAVHYSIVIGREPGRASFEAWSWARERATSMSRIDDGEWHVLLACHDPASRRLALVVDDVVEAIVPITQPFAGSPRPALRIGNNLDPNVHQPFDGRVRRVMMFRGVPAAVRQAIAADAAARVLEPGAAERMVRAWNERRRPARDASWSPVEHPARVRAVAALVQDALGLWPPPFGGRRLAGTPSPLTGASDAEPTEFADFAPDLPLDIRRGGVLVREGYRLTRVHWRTFERFFASGWLYEPTAAPRADRRPAVLCPHGHWQHGARHPVVQARCIQLARLGYVVLAVDSLHVEDDRVALSPLSAMTWANLRALEVLRAREDVDPARIGCTGASGGGQQTYYLTALDAGLAAAAPAVMVCHLREIMDPDEVHCRCNHTPHLARVVDVPEMSGVFAPRPQLFLSVTGDWTRQFPTEGYPAIAKLYAALGAADAVASLQWDKGHDYDRPMRNAMYAFFERALHGVAEPDAELEPVSLPVEPLEVLRGLDRDDVPRDVASIASEFRERLAAPPLHRDAEVARVRARLRALLGGPAAAPRLRTVHDGDVPAALLVAADQDVEIPVLSFRGAPAQLARTALMIAAEGKGVVLRSRPALVDALRAHFGTVWLADVRYTGELDAGRGFRDLHGRFVGEDEGRLAVRDVTTLIAAASAVADEPRHVTVIAFGWTGAPALLASALDDRVDALIAADLGPSWREADRRPRLARILLHGDLPEAAFASFAQRLVLGGVGTDPAWAVVEAVRGAMCERTAAALDEDAIVAALHD